jgi:hypothetical protein
MTTGVDFSKADDAWMSGKYRSIRCGGLRITRRDSTVRISALSINGTETPLFLLIPAAKVDEVCAALKGPQP